MLYPETPKIEAPKRFTPNIERDNTKVVPVIEKSRPLRKRSEIPEARKGVAMEDSSLPIIPESVSGLAKKLLTGKNIKNNNSYDQYSKAIIYKAAENADKRKSDGIDYKGLGTEQDDKDLDLLQAGKMNIPTSIHKLRKSKVLDVAASLGGASVKKGEEGRKKITDYYDFVNKRSIKDNGKLKDDYMSNGKISEEHLSAYKRNFGSAGYRDILPQERNINLKSFYESFLFIHLSEHQKLLEMAFVSAKHLLTKRQNLLLFCTMGHPH